MALAESAWLGERGGVARGAGLRDLWPGWLPAEPGRCGRLPSASGCGLSRRVLASLWREESGCRGCRSCAAGAAADAADRGEALSGWRGDRSCAAEAAESRAAEAEPASGSGSRAGRSCEALAAVARAARSAATLFGGGVAWRGLAWCLGCHSVRPLVGV